MRKLILLLLLIASPAWAGGVISGAVMSGCATGAGAAAAGDSCAGGLIFSWHCENVDVTVGTPAGCSISDTTATAVSLAAIDTGGTPAPKDGSGACDFPTYGDRYEFSIDDTTAKTTGTFDVWVYVETYGTNVTIVDLYIDGSNAVKIVHTSPSQFRLIHTSAAGNKTAVTEIAGNAQVNTWYHIIAKYDTTIHGSNYLSICADETDGTGNCGYGTSQPQALSGTATILVGDRSGVTSDQHIDLIKIYNTWR